MMISLKEKSWRLKLLHEVVLVKTIDRGRAERSRLTWREEVREDAPNVYVLTPLGVLNGLFGLVVNVTS